jgi:hypothetical protein
MSQRKFYELVERLKGGRTRVEDARSGEPVTLTLLRLRKRTSIVSGTTEESENGETASEMSIIHTNKRFNMIKFSRAISRVNWLSGEKTNVSKTISVLVLRVPCIRDVNFVNR